MDKKIHLIWQTPEGIQNLYEREYLTDYVFRETEHDFRVDEAKYSLVMDCSVVIYSCNSPDAPRELKRYLREFRRKKCRFALFHLSNECLAHSYGYARHAAGIFRNYYDPRLTGKNITFVPLGFQSGFLNHSHATLEASERPHAFAFIGQFSKTEDRMQLADYLQHRRDCFIHATNAWNCPTSLGVSECREVYQRTRFVPCPKGWAHPDSFRIMESLECGAVPILKRYGDTDYFDKVWGSSPLPKVDSWEELDHYHDMDSDAYRALHGTVMNWYGQFRDDYPKRVRATLHSLFSEGTQCPSMPAFLRGLFLLRSRNGRA